MNKTDHLTTEDRDFFHLLAEVIFSNPFSFERKQLESTLGIKASTAQGDHHYSALIPGLQNNLNELQQRGICSIRDVDGEDRQYLEYAYLFHIYHRYVDQFDALIREQLNSPDGTAAVSFADDLMQDLGERGFNRPDACRYVALFYQLRRAFYFIGEALVGDAPCMRQLRHALWNNIFTTDVRLYERRLWDRMEDFSTLLLGETGSGKGSAAAAIGRSGLIPYDEKSGRFRYSFVDTYLSINLSEFPETLIESELFGHRKGAFTGAIDSYKGILERCNPHGALFLDEIGDIGIPIQIKLLNVLQDRRFSPVGSHERKRFQGRVIAATNRQLDERRDKGAFRDDFYYRLCSDVIVIPSLHQRLQEDDAELSKLVSQLVTRLTGSPDSGLDDRVLSTLSDNVPSDYTWPGNVRELEQAVRGIILNNHYRVSGKQQTRMPEWLDQTFQGKLTAQELLSHYCQMLYTRQGTYEEVANMTGLDRRTVKKYILFGSSSGS